VLPEIAALERLGHEVWVVPMYPRGELLHADAEAHLARTLSEPLLSAEIAGEAARALPAAPGRALSLLARTAAARPRIAVKNVAVYPKGLWLARRIRDARADRGRARGRPLELHRPSLGHSRGQPAPGEGAVGLLRAHHQRERCKRAA